MISRLSCAAALATVLVGVGVPGSGHAAAKTPTQAFIDYHATAAKAAALSEVLPHLSAEYRAMLESRPKADHAVWLGRLKDATVKDLKVGKETITGDKATLEATGTRNGTAMRGKIMLVREAGAWKLDEQFWST